LIDNDYMKFITIIEFAENDSEIVCLYSKKWKRKQIIDKTDISYKEIDKIYLSSSSLLNYK